MSGCFAHVNNETQKTYQARFTRGKIMQRFINFNLPHLTLARSFFGHSLKNSVPIQVMDVILQSTITFWGRITKYFHVSAVVGLAWDFFLCKVTPLSAACHHYRALGWGELLHTRPWPHHISSKTLIFSGNGKSVGLSNLHWGLIFCTSMKNIAHKVNYRIITFLNALNGICIQTEVEFFSQWTFHSDF